MASKKELQALIVLAGKIDPSLQKALKDTEKKTKQLSKTTKLFGTVASKSFSAMKTGVAIGATAIGAAMMYVGKKGIELASDLTEVQNVVDVTFGKDAKQINKWATNAIKSYGLSELSAKQYTSTLGAMMKSSGVSGGYLATMSENLTALAGDFASFYNLDPAEAFEKIRSGLAGETDPLQQLGIDMRIANLQAYAMSKGIKTSFDKLSQADQTILRYNYLLSVSKDAQGDFARTSGSFANQLRLLKTNFSQLSAKMMSSTLPAFQKLFKKGNEMMDAFANDPKKMDALQNKITSITDKVIAALPTAVRLAGKFGSGLMDIFNISAKVAGFIQRNWTTIRPIILGIVGAMILWKTAMAITSTVNALKIAVDGVTTAMTFLSVAKMKDVAATIYLQSLYAKDAIVKGVSTTATIAYTAATKAGRVATLAATAAQWAMNSAIMANPLTWIILAIVVAIGVLIAGIYLLWKHWKKVSTFLVTIWQSYVMPFFSAIGGWFIGVWNGMVSGFKAAWSGVKGWFISLWDGLLSIVKGYLNLYILPFNLLIKGLNKIHIKMPKWLGGKEFGVSIPLIPTFAKGGFANQPSIFGEAGPEAAIPLKRTPRSLSLLSKTAQILGVGGEAGTGSPTFVFSPNYGAGTTSEQVKKDADDFFARAEEWWNSRGRDQF